VCGFLWRRNINARTPAKAHKPTPTPTPTPTPMATAFECDEPTVTGELVGDVDEVEDWFAVGRPVDELLDDPAAVELSEDSCDGEWEEIAAVDAWDPMTVRVDGVPANEIVSSELLPHEHPSLQQYSSTPVILQLDIGFPKSVASLQKFGQPLDFQL